MRVGQLIARCVALALSATAFATPKADQNLVLTAPVRSWDEAIPLGNGLIGGLLWGEGNAIHLGLDRGDLWDERTYGPKEWWKTQTWSKGGGMWENAYKGPFPSKLPAGRVEISLGDGQEVQSFELNYATAEGLARLSDGRVVRVFFSATEPVALLRIPGPAPANIEVLSPLAVSKRVRGGSAGPDSHSVNALGYAEAATGREGTAQWYVQDAAEGLKYCACIETKQAGGDVWVAIALTCTTDEPDVLALARRRCSAALAKGYDAMLRPHAAWWEAFWAQSSVDVPEPAIQQYYAFARYLYGAGSRAGAPPMPLQGVWSANNGSLPPWKGDYHNDLNTQMTYIGYQAAGLFDQGMSWLGYLDRLTSVWRAFAHDFYGTDGLATPGVMSLGGQPLGGWGAYSLSPTMTAWNAHLFYLHWRYTMDDRFLRDHAYPWCSGVGECMAGLLKPDTNGVLKLLRSSSPEVNGNFFCPPNSTYDIACLKMLFLSLEEMADALGKPAEAGKWADLARGLGDIHVARDGEIEVWAGGPLRFGSHRHHSHLIGIFPFNLTTMEGNSEDRRRIATTLARPECSNRSHYEWCGYSWSWMSCLRARVGDAEGAIRHLDVFQKAYLSRNGFHVNQDQSRMGFGAGGGRPFTLEGNFLGLQAVHEMLLQSWSPTPGRRDTEIIRIFPATPWRWHDASFADLRAEGGHRVSAKRENNATTWFRIVAGHAGIIRLRDNFGGRAPSEFRKVGDNFEFAVKAGDVIEASLARPAEPPPAPADLAEPVVIRYSTGIVSNSLPLRIGAASDGSNLFTGDVAFVVVTGKTLSEAEIAALADPKLVAGDFPITPVHEPRKLPALTDAAHRLDGGYLEIPAAAAPDGQQGLTLAAWVRPAGFPPAGMRIIDKCPVAAPHGYILDTYPSNSLRLVTRDPHVVFAAGLPAGTWTHVAATVDGKTGTRTLYVNGKAVVEN